MPYKFDVFISYKNQPGLVTWVQDHFQPFLQTWLDNELTHPAKIFRDKVSIAAGDEWNHAIKDALACSKIVVAVLTPQYFTSEWCVAEWLSFENREKQSPATKNMLLIPLKYSNGSFFPKMATDRQFTTETELLDVNGTVIPPRSTEAVALEKKVKAIAKLLVDRLKLAPAHKSFPVVDPGKVKLPKLPNPQNPTP